MKVYGVIDMKVIKSFTGYVGIQFIYDGLLRITSLTTLEKEADEFQNEVRSICKTAGIHNKHSEYPIKIDFPNKRMFITVNECGKNRQKSHAVAQEAVRRQYVWEIVA